MYQILSECLENYDLCVEHKKKRQAYGQPILDALSESTAITEGGSVSAVSQVVYAIIIFQIFLLSGSNIKGLENIKNAL